MAQVDWVLPEDFVQRLRDVHGAAVAEGWLAGLDETLAACGQRWGLTSEGPFERLSYYLVVRARLADGTGVVLKLSPVGDEALMQEGAALRAYGGVGCARLLDADAQLGALLIERLQPGTSLRDLALRDDAAATRVLAEVIRVGRRPVEGAMPEFWDMVRWWQSLRGYVAAGETAFSRVVPPVLPGAMVAAAVGVFEDLSARGDDLVLLHGDLHHENVLADGDGWRMIDPKGVVGPGVSAVGALLVNPLPEVGQWPDLAGVMRRRLAILHEGLGYGVVEMARVGLAHAVLNMVWDWEDHGAVSESTMRCGAVLMGI